MGNFDVAKLKKIDFVYPGIIRRPVIVQDVLLTKDGRYVLEYLETKNGRLVSDYTEIIENDNIWWRYPFKKSLNDYDFVDFERDFSSDLIDKLPSEIRFKVFVKNETKTGKVNYVQNEFANDTILDLTGSKVSEHDNKYVFMVLLANDNNRSILKDSGYNFDFPFPAFSVPYEVVHEAFKNSSKEDENFHLTYKQDEYSREDLPMSVRRTVEDYLRKQEGNVIDVSSLPVLDVLSEDGNKIQICFVSCPDINLFSNVFKADSLQVDKESFCESSYENQLDSALHYEKPLIISHRDMSLSTNGVKHRTYNK